MFVFKILKDSEDYTNEHFDDLLNRVFHSEVRLGAWGSNYALSEIIILRRLFFD